MTLPVGAALLASVLITGFGWTPVDATCPPGSAIGPACFNGNCPYKYQCVFFSPFAGVCCKKPEPTECPKGFMGVTRCGNYMSCPAGSQCYQNEICCCPEGGPEEEYETGPEEAPGTGPEEKSEPEPGCPTYFEEGPPCAAFQGSCPGDYYCHRGTTCCRYDPPTSCPDDHKEGSPCSNIDDCADGEYCYEGEVCCEPPKRSKPKIPLKKIVIKTSTPKFPWKKIWKKPSKPKYPWKKTWKKNSKYYWKKYWKKKEDKDGKPWKKFWKKIGKPKFWNKGKKSKFPWKKLSNPKFLWRNVAKPLILRKPRFLPFRLFGF